MLFESCKLDKWVWATVHVVKWMQYALPRSDTFEFSERPQPVVCCTFELGALELRTALATTIRRRYSRGLPTCCGRPTQSTPALAHENCGPVDPLHGAQHAMVQFHALGQENNQIAIDYNLETREMLCF